MDREKFTKDLRSGIKAQELMGRKGADARNSEVAFYTLRQDLGDYGPPDSVYDLDRVSADTLLAHSRQDAAHTLLNTLSLMKWVKGLITATILLLFLNIVILWRVW